MISKWRARSWLLLLTLTFLFTGSDFALAVVSPAKDLTGAPVNDPFLGYQWALFTRNQSFSRDRDDIHPKFTYANPKFSIGWRNFDSLMKRDVVVAVIDTGVDPDHPELKDSLLPGLNVATRDQALRKLPDDDLGHGTHMASIMAAKNNDQEGMAGLSNRIKILPIRFYDGNESPNHPGRKPLTERIIEALSFAREKKVDVINMSVGWPRVANKPEIEEAFRQTLDQGILIVVGAGNDHHEAQIYPCAYRGVICVGSIDMDGQLSDFSNFGGHVDMVAPGQGILGLWPMAELVSYGFGPKGYEVKSGTSQATPMVAGTAAILRGIYPEESAAQIRQRILMSAKRWYPEITFGLLDMQKAIDIKDPELTAPIFKGIEMVVVDPQSGRFDLPVVIESTQLKSLSIKVISLSSEVQFQELQAEDKKNQDSRRYYRLQGVLKNRNASNRLKYQVQVGEEVFEHQILMVTDFKLLKKETLPFLGGQLAQVNDPRGNREIQFWSSEEQKEGGLKLKLWRLENQSWTMKEVLLPNVDAAYPGGIGVTVSDWMFEGQDSYLFAGITYDKSKKAESKEPKEVRFFYLNRNLQVQMDLPLKADDILPAYKNAQDMVVARVSNAQGRFIKVPVFWSTDLIPQLDRNPDAFAFEKNEEEKRIYYLQPRQEEQKNSYLTTRTLTAFALKKFVRDALDLKLVDIQVLGLNTQSLEDIRLGRIKLILFVGRQIKGSIYQLVVDDLNDPWKRENLVELDTGPHHLANSAFEEAFVLQNKRIDRTTEIQSVYSFNSARSLFAEGLGYRLQKLGVNLTGERIIAPLKSFLRGPEQVTLFETTDAVRAQGNWEGRNIDTQIQVYRSTFLPGNMFSQTLMPVIVGEEQRPAIMMNNSNFFSRTVSIYVLNSDGELKAPVNLSFMIPENCMVAPLTYWNEQGFSRILMRCQKEGDEGSILLFDLQ